MFFLSELPDVYYFEIMRYIVSVVETTTLLVSICIYILHSIAVMKMAKKRNIKNGWLAWIPFAGDWMLGKVSEPTGQGKKTGVALLVLKILTSVVSIIFTIVIFAFLMVLEFSENSSMEFLGAAGVSFLIAFLIGLVILLGVSITYLVIKFIAYYRICQNFAGQSGTGYFIGILLTTLFGVDIVPPILMLVLASKTPEDAGEVPQAEVSVPQVSEVLKTEGVPIIAPEVIVPEAQEAPQTEEKAEEADEE